MVRFADLRRLAHAPEGSGPQNTMVWLTLIVRWGICLIVIWSFLLVMGALAMQKGMTVDIQGTLGGAVLYFLTIPAGVGGLTLTTFGVGTMILRRMFDSVLRIHSTMQDFLILFLLFVTLVTGVLLWGGDLTFGSARAVVMQVFGFSFDAPGDWLLGIHLVLLNITFIYVPLSRMSSYVERAAISGFPRANPLGKNVSGKNG